MAQFNPAIAFVLKNEGALEDNPADKGGLTNYGISLVFYRQAVKPDATETDIRNLSVADATGIYESQFWIKNRYAELNYQQLATKMLDLSVNLGAPSANKLLQKALNTFCISQLMPDLIAQDGIVGIKTIDAANAEPPARLYNALIAQAKAYYAEIVAANPADSIFISNWLARLSLVP